jgi:DNA mismatch repair protein MutL
MPQIFVLPEHIASQIAAGEVVERPAAVVKELVENSIDAGAAKIVVDIKDNCRYIRVADNGHGMEVADASLAFQRHATSKLSSANDLWNLNTLGFRGEALPSIAAVSRLTCYTRTDKNEVGTKVFCMDGAMTVSEAGCAKGTIIEVEELFYNVPARLSFLKKPATEFAHILDIMQSLAISYPTIAFELSLDGTNKLKTSGLNGLDGAIAESNFFSAQENSITIEAKDGILGLEIVGRLISPTNFRGDRKGIMTIVNKRPVRCALAYKALDYAYADLIPRGRYPLAVVNLKVNPGELDINIHPTKKEIRYSRGNEVYLFMQRQIAQALRNSNKSSFAVKNIAVTDGTERNDGVDSFSQRAKLDFAPWSAKAESKQLSLKESADTIYFDMPMSAHTSSTVTIDEPAKSFVSFSNNETINPSVVHAKPLGLPLDWRIAGYLGNTYILLETKEGLSIVEQHIAHERTLYEKILARTVATEGQTLLISLPLQLTNEQQVILKDNLKDFNEEGFEFEIDDDQINCTQVPIELAHKDYASILQNMLQELAESSNANPKLDIVKSLACQSAIKNGMPLAQAQIIELLSQWNSTPRNETCPHGRPIKLDFSYDKLFQMFHPA